MEIEHYAVPDTNIQDSHFCTSEEDNIGRNIVYIKSFVFEFFCPETSTANLNVQLPTMYMYTI